MKPLLSPATLMWLQWTLLLALGWLVHGALRKRHSRWRLILWRSLLVFSLAMPLMRFVPALVRIPISQASPSPVEAPSMPAAPAADTAVPVVAQKSPAPATPHFVASASAPRPLRTRAISWGSLLAILCGLGAAGGGFRLLRLHVQLHRLQQESVPANTALQQQARDLQTSLGVMRPVEVRVSTTVSSPFACGLRRPLVLLPQTLAEELAPEELAALLAHELAHFRRHDLFWCVGWRWMQTLFWFQPLVWKIPAAHNLACEQEADRIAADHLRDRSSYSQLLARLALRVLAAPRVETRLALSATSQIAERLRHLARRHSRAWTRRHSLAGFGLASALFLFVAGCRLARTETPSSTRITTNPAHAEFQTVLVVVLDEDGKPIPGATITPDGFRVKGIHSADAYGWNRQVLGAPEAATTDASGRAHVKYPVVGIPQEKELTGALIFNVTHPEFCTKRIQTYYVDRINQPIQLTRAIPLEISAYAGDHQPVTDFTVALSQESVRPEDWQKTSNGLVFPGLSPGGHLLQLTGRLPSGEIGYSDSVALTAEAGKPCRLSIEMKPGIRLEGRIDGKVPRPVKNGRVMISVRPKEYPALLVIEDFYAIDKQYGGRYFWHSYRPIREDGTFVFESVPPGEADVVVLGDGFVSESKGTLQNRVNGELRKGAVMAVPQAFPLTAPVTTVEVTTEPSATLELSVTTKDGKPIEGVWAGMYPTAFRMRGVFGWLKSSEVPYRDVPPLSDPVFSGKTDANGKLVLPNLPAQISFLNASHPDYEVPLQKPKDWRDRNLRIRLSPGETNKLELFLNPRGTEFIGASK